MITDLDDFVKLTVGMGRLLRAYKDLHKLL